MTTTQRRIALLTGASLTTLGVAAPAAAATTNNPGILHVVVGPSPTDTLTICLAAGTCDFGIDASGSGLVQSNPAGGGGNNIAQAVNGTTASATGTIVNHGNAEIDAHATASGAGSQTAQAHVVTGIFQRVTAVTDALAIDLNDGTLTIDASANAHSTNSAALASATLNWGIGAQRAVSTSVGNASALLTNEGTLGISANAHATGASSAVANAAIASIGSGFGGTGIWQVASQQGTGNALAAISNTGTIHIGASAVAIATTGSASANAAIQQGIVQTAHANNGSATANVTNAAGGTIGITAFAHAHGSGGTGQANASISSAGISQNVTGSVASAKLSNAGTINIHATAIATGTSGFNTANAVIHNGIIQNASAATTASANLTNAAGGVISIVARASANGANANAGSVVGTVSSGAAVIGGIVQNALASTGSAAANLTNHGSITIAAIANGFGTDTVDAVAHVVNGISQNATASTLFAGGGNASANLVNDGTITIGATAHATGTSGQAQASAHGTNLISQHVHAVQTATTTTNHAVASISNAAGGLIREQVVAVAHQTGATSAASANAVLNGGIAQSAHAKSGADATASLTNGGTINISAVANATGVGTGATPVAGIVVADATVAHAIHQTAAVKSGGAAGSAAHATLSNAAGGSINILASAVAHGGSASASANVTSGIVQHAGAKSGNAIATLVNNGSIDIGAVAHATGDATANASVNGGIGQVAGAGYVTAYGTPSLGAALVPAAVTGASASALIVNNGSINIHATAIAHNTVTGFAGAFANVTNGVTQVANATSGNATVSLTGTGSINVGALASAVADSGAAQALATVVNAIGQSAHATNGNAHNSFSQATVAIHATAIAHGNANSGTATPAASAIASVTRGIGQFAFATATPTAITGGTAVSASNVLTNAGSISILAHASAIAPKITVVGTGSTNHTTFPLASASAHVGTGIRQNATGQATLTTTTVAVGGTSNFTYAGAASAANTLTNSGSITVGAMATATGAGASALAGVGFGVIQSAHAGGATSSMGGTSDHASNSLTNSAGGVITVAAVANANGGTSAHAAAGVSVGVGQAAGAIAKSGLASASDTLTNDGTIMVAASANATGNGTGLFGTAIAGAAAATAAVGVGVGQIANARATGFATKSGPAGSAMTPGSANASVALTNTGTIAVLANAAANAASAAASAAIGTGIEQVAAASGDTAGSASASLNNAGLISVLAGAAATGTTAAHAVAAVRTGIFQEANASAKSGAAVANASITNAAGATIAVGATANASAAGHAGTLAFATASAFVGAGIRQVAEAFGSTATANGTIVNNGTIDVGASANAFVGREGDAFAVAVVSSGIDQIVLSNGSAIAAITNAGAINVMAHAGASGDENASATAGVGFGIVQVASGFNTTAGQGSGTIDNSGTINVAAIANAVGGHDVFASAFVSEGVKQVAFGGFTGTAVASVVNTGPINVDAIANATGGGEGTALAHASGISQFAEAGAAGSALLSNSDAISVAASANVTVGNAAHRGDYALASAVAGGINQLALGGTRSTFTGATTFTQAFTTGAVASSRLTGVAFNATATGSLSPSGSALSKITNSGSLDVLAHASASGGAGALALANAHAISQAAAGTSAVAEVTNSGTIGVVASAVSKGGNGAAAIASALGVAQSAAAAASHFTGHFHGTGATLHKTTLGGTSVFFPTTFFGNVHLTSATETVVFTPIGPATVTLNNSGAINVMAHASASNALGGPAIGGTTTTPAFAAAGATGVVQNGKGTTVTLTADNSGTIDVGAAATANAGATSALAVASAKGIVQGGLAAATTLHLALTTATFTSSGGHPSRTSQFLTPTANGVTFTPVGAVNASVTNSGAITVIASASANAATAAVAAANATGILQAAATSSVAVNVATAANLSVDNSGTLVVGAHANAAGTAASAAAGAVGVLQVAAATSENLSIVNSGHATVTAHAVADAVGPTATGATATTGVGPASASAVALGFGQIGVGATTGAASVTNSGTLNVAARATAHGTSANAFASAIGVWQSVDPLPINFTNSGTLNVLASAKATGSAGAATATAKGYYGSAFGGGTETATVVNSGAMHVTAHAVAPGTAIAHAVGISVVNAPVTTVAGTVVNVNAQPMNGSITNSGTLNVLAMAAGGPLPVGTGAATTPGSSAVATGINVFSGVNNMTISNSGTIMVTAVTNGGNAEAEGIYVQSNGTATPGALDVTTINNSGDIIARFSTDGGTTFHRGEAIDMAEEPNRSVINLMGAAAGPAHIYGNIELASDLDTINVTDGETIFNGVVNNDLCGGFLGVLTLDNPAQNDCGVGTLNINTGGNLHLVIDPVDGPSYVFMDTLNMGADGTITFDLPAPVGGGHNEPLGTYPQVFVDTANLNGHIVANIATPANGLWDTTTYQNVIDAVTRNGTFATCTINGIPTGSLLISAGCIYDNAANVDIGVVRAPFESPSGLNQNAISVATGLDSYFNVNLTGGAANMFADLFKFNNNVNYNIALNMLSGSVYANYLNSFPSLGVHYNDLVDHATNCEIPALAGSVLECRASGPIHIWGQADYQTRKVDGDNEAGTSRSKRFTGLIGVDTDVSPAAIVGIEAGYVSNNLHDNQFGDSAKGNGWEVGLYGDYDPGPWFAKAMTTYSSFNGNSDRHINFAGLAPGATFVANPQGSPDVKMWTFGLHGGARFSMSANSVITPYLNLDYVNSKLQGFSEDNGNGAALTVTSSSSNHAFLTGGVKWATQMGGVVPELNLGYRYRFGDKRSDFHGFFTPDPENDFNIISAAQRPGPDDRWCQRRRQDRCGRPQDRIRGRILRWRHQPQRQLQDRSAARRSPGSAAAAASASASASGSGSAASASAATSASAAATAGRARGARTVTEAGWVGFSTPPLHEAARFK